MTREEWIADYLDRNPNATKNDAITAYDAMQLAKKAVARIYAPRIEGRLTPLKDYEAREGKIVDTLERGSYVMTKFVMTIKRKYPFCTLVDANDASRRRRVWAGPLMLAHEQNPSAQLLLFNDANGWTVNPDVLFEIQDGEVVLS